MPVDFDALRAALDDDLEQVGRDEYNAFCCAHDDGRKNRERSLSIRDNRDGTATVFCHAGCSFPAILAALRLNGHHTNGTGGARRPRSDDGRSLASSTPKQRTDYALKLWRQSQPAAGTLVEAYLRNRGITIPPPPTLRFHPHLKHKESGAFAPAMVAAIAVGDSRTVVAILRTFLKRDGSGHLEPKKLLGSAHGGAVRCAPASRRLVLAEGIETALSVMQATGLPAWSAISAPNLPNVLLPAEVEEVVVASDNDKNGAGQRAARKAAQVLSAAGKRVWIMTPRVPGADYNDVLCGKDTAPLGGAL